MRILFICDYFPPFSKGGGEISSYWQAKKLTQQGVEVVVLAPKYQNRLKIKKENFKRYWYNLPFRLENTSPILFLNPFFFFYLLWQIIKACQKEKVNLIHCQGKYSAPSSIFAKVFLKIPVILALRDYKGICNHAFCLYKNKKSCNLFSFFKKDFDFYYQNYIRQKNIFSFLIQLVFSYFGRINASILSFFMKKADKLVCVSNFIKKVYKVNGFPKEKLITIYNLLPQKEIKEIELSRKLKDKMSQYKYIILYVGKLSLGKGAGLLINTAQEIIKKRKNVLFIFCGKIHYPIQKVKSKQLLFLGRVDQQLLFKIMKLVDFVCIPSIWPEPLSRVTLEAFSLAKPVLSSITGGQKEIVSKQNGWLFKPATKALTEKLNEVLDNKAEWHVKGEKGRELVIELEKKQLYKLISLYNATINS